MKTKEERKQQLDTGIKCVQSLANQMIETGHHLDDPMDLIGVIAKILTEENIRDLLKKGVLK